MTLIIFIVLAGCESSIQSRDCHLARSCCRSRADPTNVAQEIGMFRAKVADGYSSKAATTDCASSWWNPRDQQHGSSTAFER